MTKGMVAKTNTVKAMRDHNNAANACSAKARAACGPSVSKRPANKGTKAMLKAPSANRLRNRLGSRKATKKTSASGQAPSAAAISMSRIKPRTLLTMVMPPMVAI